MSESVRPWALKSVCFFCFQTQLSPNSIYIKKWNPKHFIGQTLLNTASISLSTPNQIHASIGFALSILESIAIGVRFQTKATPLRYAFRSFFSISVFFLFDFSYPDQLRFFYSIPDQTDFL